MKRLTYYAQMEPYSQLRKAEGQYAGQQYQRMVLVFWYMSNVKNVKYVYQANLFGVPCLRRYSGHSQENNLLTVAHATR